MKYDKQKVLEAVKDEFQLRHKSEPGSSFRIFLFYVIRTGKLLFNDTYINHDILLELTDEALIKCEGIHFHQGLKCIRYKFIGYKYPYKFYRGIPRELKMQVMDRDNHACVKCGTSHKLQIDHVYAWSMGGLTELSNLQVLCKKCNYEKSNK